MARIIHSRIKLFVEILFLVNKLLHYVEDKNTFKNFQFLETTITIHRMRYNFYLRHYLYLRNLQGKLHRNDDIISTT